MEYAGGHEAQARINALIQLLANSQEQVIGAQEGRMPLEQYRALKTQRQLWSDELRELLGETAAPETTERTPDVLLATVDNSLVAAIPFVLLAKSEQIDDTTICEHPNLFVAWDEHYTGARGDIVRDGDGVFRQIHDILDHAQNTIRPSEDTSNQLWRPLGKPGEEWPQWSRPILPDDSYQIGDKVTYNDKRWICSAVGGDGRNVWAPSEYGWTEAE